GRPVDGDPAYASGRRVRGGGDRGRAADLWRAARRGRSRGAHGPRDLDHERDRARRNPLRVQRNGAPRARRGPDVTKQRPGSEDRHERANWQNRPAVADFRERGTFLLLRASPPKAMLRVHARTTPARQAGVACAAASSGMTFQSPRTFNTWLRGQLKEKKMSQRQLALQSGVDHSTISRLTKGDRMPSLGSATKLARGLREIRDEAEGPGYFASVSARQILPTTRVEY